MKVGDLIAWLKPGVLNGKWCEAHSAPVKIVGEFETYFICRHPRCSPFFLSKKKAILVKEKQ